MRVLLADDHQLLRQAIRRALEDAGMTVVAEAGDGGEAVRLAGELHPDVVVMDVSMPVLDGVGFEVNTVEGEHYGLVGMRERADAIGARLSIDSRPERGTRVVVEVILTDQTSGQTSDPTESGKTAAGERRSA